MRSVNQNHHLYVVKGVGTVTEASDLGTIEARVCGDNLMDRDLYFLYKGRDGVTKSDLIPLNQITYMKYIPASQMTTKLRKVKVTLDSTVHTANSGAAIVGQDYILNIVFQQFYGLGAEDNYVKTAALHVTSATSAADDFYGALADELNAAFSREVGASASDNPYLTFTASNVDHCLYIEEKEQPWALGKWEVERLVFDVVPSTIYVSGEEVTWGTVTEVTSGLTEINNSKRIADLEWFTFSERADFYHGMNYPNDFPFTPIVNAADTNGYDVLEIHFAYQGTCEDIQKSEKDITIVASAASSGTIMKAVTGAIESVAGAKVNDGASLTKVATPVITYNSSNHKATVTCSTPGATMRYTTNGTAPTTAIGGTAVSGEITLTSGQTLKVVGFKDGMDASDAASQAYS